MRGAPEEARTTRRGSTPTTCTLAAGLLDPREQEHGREPRALGGAEVDGRQRRPGQGRELAVVHPDERDVVRDVEPGIAEGGEDADREQVVRAEDRVGLRAREQAARRRDGPARP